MAFKLPLRKIFHKHVPGAPRFSLVLSWPMVGALSLILVACVGWSFFMGYMVGKGQNPETQLEAMTGIKLAGDKPEASSEEIPELEEPVLDKQENVSEEEAYPFNKPEGRNTEAWPSAEKPSASETAPAVMASKKDMPRPKRDKAENVSVRENGRYDYLFQVAAYKSLADANKLRANLEKAGYRAAVQKSGKVQLVTVRLRGSGQDVKKLSDKLATYKLGKPMQLSRKPLESGKAARGGK